MTYALNIWSHPKTNETRLYIGGTNRSSVYLKLSREGTVVWSSKANDTPHKYQTGNHYGKIRKDGEAASEVAEAFGIQLGKESTVVDWDRAVHIAKDGIQVGG